MRAETSREPRQGNSAWSPLAVRMFRALWIASVASHIGTWMQNVGAAWLMTSLSPNPTMVALVQAATSLPFFLFALPAGAMADIIDRRRLLLITQSWMLLAAGTLGFLTASDRTSPWLLLALTFVLGIGAALNAPAWQAIIPELVPRSELRAAVTLNGVGFNLARAVGPALGGAIVVLAGPAAVFLLNALSFLGVLLVLSRWRRRRDESMLPAEDVLGAMRAAIRYVRHAPSVRAVLLRTGIFIVGGSALWALLPLIAREQLGLGAIGYGMLLGCLGAGAVGGAALLPRLQEKVPTALLLASATVLFAVATLAPALVSIFSVLAAAMFLGGLAWITLMSTFSVAVQMGAPRWIRARALAIHGLTLQGGTAFGSALWGFMAERAGVFTALSCGAATIVVGLALAARYRVRAEDRADLAPSFHWPDPILAVNPALEAGPVLVTVEYIIQPARMGEFIAAMQGVRTLRLRDGAYRWGLFYDPVNPSRCLETFVVESWPEHLRQHERVTLADKRVEDVAYAFHVGDRPPAVSHLIYAREEDWPPG